MPLLIWERIFYIRISVPIGTVPPRGSLMAPLLLASVGQRERLYLLFIYSPTNTIL